MRAVWWATPGLLAGLVFSGCTGHFEYVGPADGTASPLSAVVDRTVDEVWNCILAALEGSTLDVVSADKESGVLTIVYSGDPERYVDCGRIASTVTNLCGTRTYRFPAANASAEYELMNGREILVVARRMTLEIRMAATVSRVEARRTRVSVSGRYTLTRTLTTRDALDREHTASDAIQFTSEHGASFPGPIACRSIGALEAVVLSASSL